MTTGQQGTTSIFSEVVMLVKNREQYVKAVDQMANPTGWTILRSTSCSETLTQVDGFD